MKSARSFEGEVSSLLSALILATNSGRGRKQNSRRVSIAFFGIFVLASRLSEFRSLSCVENDCLSARNIP